MSLTLKMHKQDWEELGNMDPCWAILGDPKLKFGKWDINELGILMP
jgi:hypothetical protein